MSSMLAFLAGGIVVVLEGTSRCSPSGRERRGNQARPVVDWLGAARGQKART